MPFTLRHSTFVHWTASTRSCTRRHGLYPTGIPAIGRDTQAGARGHTCTLPRTSMAIAKSWFSSHIASIEEWRAKEEAAVQPSAPAEGLAGASELRGADCPAEAIT